MATIGNDGGVDAEMAHISLNLHLAMRETYWRVIAVGRTQYEAFSFTADPVLERYPQPPRPARLVRYESAVIPAGTALARFAKGCTLALAVIVCVAAAPRPASAWHWPGAPGSRR
jgi:hypothetical protein